MFGKPTYANLIWEACNAAFGPKKTFSIEDIAVAAHKHNPQVFCIAGYVQFPDLHKIWAALYGSGGIIKKRALIKNAQGKYRLGRKPVQVSTKRQVPNDAYKETAQPEQLNTEELTWVEEKLQSQAALKLAGQIPGNPSLFDALAFVDGKSLKDITQDSDDVRRPCPLALAVKEKLRMIEMGNAVDQGKINFLRVVLDKCTQILRRPGASAFSVDSLVGVE